MNTTNPIFVISSIGHSPGRRPNRIAPPRVYHRGLVVLTAISDGNEQRTQYCDHQHRTPQAADACALVTARKLGLNRAQVCRACGTVRPGTRTAASKAGALQPPRPRGHQPRPHGLRRLHPPGHQRSPRRAPRRPGNDPMNADARIRLSREIATARRIARHATSTDAEQHIRTLAKLADTTGALAARDWLLNLAALSDLHHETRAGRDEGADDA